MKNNFIQLLNQINPIIKVYEKHAQLSGEKFNIFSIIGMESDEVKTHSAFIGELLNPKGNHSLEEKPLRLFVQKVFGEEFDIDYDSSFCQKEQHIGFINENKTEGGRIDLVIRDKKKIAFVIENKIYASEQINQLLRYKNAYPEAKILYLTLEGEISKLHQNENDYKIISYKEDILNWIEICAKEAFDKPMVREILNQYAYLIRKLTNQTTNTEMKEEIQKIINDNYLESSEIYKNFEDARKSKIFQIFQDLENREIKLEDNSVWKIMIDYNSKIWDTKKYKTVLISNNENSNIFFFIKYRYSFNSPKLSKGIVHKSLELLEGFNIPINRKDNSIRTDIMDIVGRNDLVEIFQKNSTTFINSLLDEIKIYIEKHKEYYKELQILIKVS